MDFYSSYLTGINQIIGQNGRFARQFVANQEAGTGTTSGNTTTNGTNTGNTTGADAQTSTMLLMLFQLMAQMMSGGSTSTTSAGDLQNAFNGYLSNVSNPGGTGNILQNPAVVALQAQVNAKVAANPNAETLNFSAEDVDAVRADLKAGNYTNTDLGQALMYGLDQTPAENLQPITRLITDLTDSGELNITPFLQNDYLSKLTTDRRQALLSAVETSGLRMDSGKPNSRLIGFMLDTLAKPGNEQSKLFVQTFLQDFYDQYGQQPDTPVGKILAQTLDLASVTANPDGKLVFESLNSNEAA